MKDNLVVKHNSIIEASYTLSIAEQRLLFACISRLDSRVKKKGEIVDLSQGFTISVAEAQDLFYTEKSKYNAYTDLKQASEKLFDRVIRMKSDSGQYETLTRWVSTVRFDEINQTSTLYFHEQIRPYITQLGKEFTEYRLKHICQLSNKYAPHLYELIICWFGQNTSFKEIEISEFRDLLGIGTKYKQHRELTKRVIEPAVKQINEYTNFNLEISFRKNGRAFKWVQLRYQQKKEDIEREQIIFKRNLEKRQAGKAKRLEANKKNKQKKEWEDFQRTKEEFEKFSSSIKIDVGMRFSSKTLGKNYEVEEGILINSQDFKHQFGFNGQTNFLQNNDIKKLIFMKEFEQITNEDDTETGDIFND